VIHCDRSKPVHYATDDGWEGHGITQILHAIEPYHGNREAMERGSAVHAACALIALGLEPSVPPAFQYDPQTFEGYCQQYRLWSDARVGEMWQVEEPMLCSRLHVATRIDFIGIMQTLKNELSLVEIKTGQPHHLHPMQVMAQKKMDGMDKAVKMRLLYLQPDSYKEVPVLWNPRTWATFESMALAKWNAYQFVTKG
jgi:hypothetical protein